MTFNEEITIKVWRHAKSAARFRSLRSYNIHNKLNSTAFAVLLQIHLAYKHHHAGSLFS